MSSVHRLPGKPNWICFYTDHTGKRRCKSTKTHDKKQAELVCEEIQKIEDKARTGKLTEDRARKVIETAVADIMDRLGAPLKQRSIREQFEGWMSSKRQETSAGTFLRYQGIVNQWLTFLGGKAEQSLATLQSDDVRRYRDSLASEVANGTTNTHLKVIRVCLETAVKEQFFDKNPARLIDNLDRSKRHQRRAFTLAELKKLLAVAGQDWKTAILLGVYTGLRLGDVANLTWAGIDLAANEITCTTQKTGRTVILPMARALRRHIDALPAGDDPKAALCPSLAGRPTSSLSNAFFELMASAGLVASRIDHAGKGTGRRARRSQSELTFHALRHTATSLLKRSGVSDAVARDLIGHESEAVSRAYTHIDEETKRKAIDRLPEL